MPPVGKTRNSGPLRDDKGCFSKTCGAVIHKDDDQVQQVLYNVQNGKKIKRKTLDYMFQHNITSKKAKYVCSSCVHQIEKQTCHDLTIQREESSSNVLFKDLKENQDLYDRCLAVGTDLDYIIRSDVAALYNDKEKCSMPNLLSYDPERWLNERPPALIGLLRKLCGIEGNPTLHQNHALAKCVEILYGSRNSKLILPLSFQENLLVYSLSRSKQLVTYNSKVSPAGSSNSISKWMIDQACEPIAFPNGIVRSVFDNEQVVGKTYSVKADNKVPVSIITSHLYIVVDKESEMQNVRELAPHSWLYQGPTMEQKNDFLATNQEYVDLFRETRNDFIKNRISFVMKEHNNSTYDFIDTMISKKEELRKEKMCVECGAENESSARKCTNCKGTLISEEIDNADFFQTDSSYKPYEHFNVATNANNLSVKTGEPDMCNPGSFKNVSEILFNIGKRAGLRKYDAGKREWLFLECDGGIFTIVDKLIFNVLKCSMCNELFYGMDAFCNHRCSIIHDIEPVHEFGWLLPTPGLLHLEMNACKAFFEINWDVILHEVCSILGFTSPKALECAKKCYDHHKTFNIIEILYAAVTDELMVPYVCNCIEHGEEPSVDGYWDWAKDVSNPNYLYMQQMALTFLHSLMLFRVGCRRGNEDAIIAGREKLSLLIYGRNHPRYHRILALNRYLEVMMPDEVKQVVMASLTLSRTNNVGHYQGGDACLEEINKEAKSWVPPNGVPSEKDWLKVFRNLDDLNKIQKNVMHLCKGDREDQSHANEGCASAVTIKYSDIVPVRELIRRNKYLSYPFDDERHTNVDKSIALSHQMRNFTSEAELLRNQYMCSFLDDESDNKMCFIPITDMEHAEQTALHNQTKSEIQRQIYLKFQCLAPSESLVMEELFNKSVKNKNKEAYLNFFYMLVNDMESHVPQNVCSGSD